MMYVPKHFEITDQVVLRQFIGKYPFATVITVRGGLPVISRIPVLWFGEHIFGHLAAANAQCDDISGGELATLIFDGPHCYVSPRFYASNYPIPTWNFASVVARGQLEPLSGEQNLDSLRRLVEAFDKVTESPFAEVWEDGDFWRRANATVGFRLAPTEMIGKFKLSQNKSREDQASVIDALSGSTNPEELAIATMMRERLK